MMFVCFVLLSFISVVHSGCYQRRLCCTGRNSSCKAFDDGISHIPSLAPKPSTTFEPAYVSPYYQSSGDGYDLVYPDVVEDDTHEKIGHIVLPDVIELEGSGADDIYNKYGDNENIGLLTANTETTPAPRIEHLLFGYRVEQSEGEQTRYHQPSKHLLIRYSVLSQHLPLTVKTTPVTHSRPEWDTSKFMYLEAAQSECYCDDDCVKLGDCCSDYTFVCPPADCEVSAWSGWERCVPDEGACGSGVQQRVRHVRRDSIRGGAECPPLKEMRTCFAKCGPALTDETTVALLLDYKFNNTRAKQSRDNIYWDLPSVSEKLKTAQYYCVEYKLGWVNRNCINPLITASLHRGNTICAECQPEAQLHRNTPRCASDLEDGDKGFWKLIGPKSCNGIWTRIRRTDNCRCGAEFPDLPPYLIV